MTGFVLKVFGNTVTWATRKQNCVCLSSTEAELVALCTAVCEGLWLLKLFKDFGLNFKPLIVYEDNQGCIALINNPANNKRIKHIDLKFNFVCDQVKEKCISLSYIESCNQQADILTKGLPAVLFDKFRWSLDLRNFSEEGCCVYAKVT